MAYTYTKQNFQDGTVLTAAQLNKMEDGIVSKQDIANLTTTLDANSDNIHYPSAKAVYEYVGGLAHELMQGDLTVECAVRDADGNNIIHTYETKADALTAYSNLDTISLDRTTFIRNDLADGTLVVDKARKDGSGNTIVDTYETKEDASDKFDALQQAFAEDLTHIHVDYPEMLYMSDFKNLIENAGSTPSKTHLLSVGDSDLYKDSYLISMRQITSSDDLWYGVSCIDLATLRVISLSVNDITTTTLATVLNDDTDNSNVIYATKIEARGYVNNLRALLEDGSVTPKRSDSATIATQAMQDASGNVITDIYATKAEVSTAQNAERLHIDYVEQCLKDGTTIVGKATQDASGNVITDTYATKAEVNEQSASTVNTTQEFVSAMRYVPVVGGTSGGQAVKANQALYTYGYPSSDGETGSLYFNIGSTKTKSDNTKYGVLGGLSLHNNNGEITNLVADQATGLRTIKLPNVSGTVITDKNFPVASKSEFGGVKLELQGSASSGYTLVISTN